jgi:F-type H+-transporting ATPase subunit b
MISTALAAGADGHAVPFYLAAEFWVLVAFVIFFVLLWGRLKTMIGGALDARAEAIRREIDEARELREQAQAALADFERQRLEISAQAKEILESARAQSRAATAKAASELTAALARRERLSLDLIAQAEAKAIEELRAETAALAVQSARQLLADMVKGDTAARLVDAAIADLPKEMH